MHEGGGTVGIRNSWFLWFVWFVWLTQETKKNQRNEKRRSPFLLFDDSFFQENSFWADDQPVEPQLPVPESLGQANQLAEIKGRDVKGRSVGLIDIFLPGIAIGLTEGADYG